MKAVAVPYVIALILGIIVVAVIGYWFFVISGQGGSTAQQATCKAELLSYCSTNPTNPTWSDFTSKYTSCSSLSTVEQTTIESGTCVSS